MMQDKNWLTATEVAGRLEVSQATVGRLLKRGDLAGHKIGKQWRISPEALDRYLDSTSTIQMSEPVLQE